VNPTGLDLKVERESPELVPISRLYPPPQSKWEYPSHRLQAQAQVQARLQAQAQLRAQVLFVVLVKEWAMVM